MASCIDSEHFNGEIVFGLTWYIPTSELFQIACVSSLELGLRWLHDRAKESYWTVPYGSRYGFDKV